MRFLLVGKNNEAPAVPKGEFNRELEDAFLVAKGVC